jgi:hypothetical protein
MLNRRVHAPSMKESSPLHSRRQLAGICMNLHSSLQASMVSGIGTNEHIARRDVPILSAVPSCQTFVLRLRIYSRGFVL